MNAFQTATAGVTAVLLFVAAIPSTARALDWVPTNEEMAKYRESWNPPTHGSSFTTSADLSSGSGSFMDLLAFRQYRR